MEIYLLLLRCFRRFFIYIFNTFEGHRFEFFNYECAELFFYGIISIMLALLGYSSLCHLIYSNIERKNHIRAIEFMARDLGININISEYRRWISNKNRDKTKEIPHSAYMALPLMLGIRQKMPFAKLTGFAIAAATGCGIFLLTIFIVKLSAPKCFLIERNMFIPPIVPAAAIAAVVYMCAKDFWEYTEKKADEELDKRDPQSLKPKQIV